MGNSFQMLSTCPLFVCGEVEGIWDLKCCKSGKPKQIYTSWPFGWRALCFIYVFVYLFLELKNAVGRSVMIVKIDNKQYLQLVEKSHQHFCIWGHTVNQAEEPIWLRVIH